MNEETQNRIDPDGTTQPVKPAGRKVLYFGLLFLCVCLIIGTIMLILFRSRKVIGLYLNGDFLGYSQKEPAQDLKDLDGVRWDYYSVLGRLPQAPELTHRVLTVHHAVTYLTDAETDAAYRQAIDATLTVCCHLTVDGNSVGYCADRQTVQNVFDRLLALRLSSVNPDAFETAPGVRIASDIRITDTIGENVSILDENALFAVLYGQPLCDPLSSFPVSVPELKYNMRIPPAVTEAIGRGDGYAFGSLRYEYYYEKTVTEISECPVEITYDDTRVLHYRRILDQGQRGEYRHTYEIVCDADGTELYRTVTKAVTVSEMRPRILLYGTRETVPGVATGTFLRPVDIDDLQGNISSGFMDHRTTEWFFTEEYDHIGLDIAQERGTPVYASDGGTVTYAGAFSSYGNVVFVDHGNGYVTRYAHLHEILPEIRVGVRVAQGQQLGTVGRTGTATGNHLHFEVRYQDKPVDPASLLDLTLGGY